MQLFKKAKIDDFQVLDLLYKKLSNEFKDRLVIVKKAENLNNLILLFCDIDANMKKINKQSQLHVKLNTSNFSAIKPPFKSYNSVPIKAPTSVKVAVFPIPSTATRSYPGLIDLSNMIKQGLILQEKKDRHNSLGFCHYCGKPQYIAMDHRNSTLLVTRKQATSTFTGNLMALVSYKLLFIKEKETSLG